MDNKINETSIIRIREVMQRTGLPKSTLYEQVKKERFPKPINIGERSVGWISCEIDTWIAARIEQGWSNK